MPKPPPRQTFIPRPAPVSDNANDNVSTTDNANAIIRPPVARVRAEETKTNGLRMPVRIADDWAAWCKARGYAVGPTAGQALIEYMERHGDDLP